MAVVIGIVGSHDVVDSVAMHVGDDINLLCLGYDHESQAPVIVETHGPQVDGWLFTGIAPYSISNSAGVIDRPAVYVRYTTEALQQALIQIQLDGRDIEQTSVDTMSYNAVARTFDRADASMERVRVLPYRDDTQLEEYADFHRRAYDLGAATAITCIPQVFESLKDQIPSLRLWPTRHAIRNAMRELLLRVGELEQARMHIALGLIEFDGDSPILAKELAGLEGAFGKREDDRHVVVTTRGRLGALTAEFTELPILDRLVRHDRNVRLGFGLGFTAAEAEHQAKRALGRAKQLGSAAAVISRRGSADAVVAEADSSTRKAIGPDEMALRTGMSRHTINRLLEAFADDEDLTPLDVSKRLGVQVRTARRILSQLENAGAANRTGEVRDGTPGRPSGTYRLTIPAR